MTKNLIFLLILASSLALSSHRPAERAVSPCACQVYVPNAFSPNNDGRNDEFKPYLGAECTISEYQIKIFNRWGALVFESTDPAAGWDGEIKGEPAAQASYLYQIQYTLESNGKPEQILNTGALALLR